eukprot:3759109-Alexandrium_andersonii.AAC.1
MWRWRRLRWRLRCRRQSTSRSKRARATDVWLPGFLGTGPCASTTALGEGVRASTSALAVASLILTQTGIVAQQYVNARRRQMLPRQ